MDERQRLLAKKKELEHLIENKREIVMTPVSEWTDELSHYDQHSGDNGSDLYEKELQMSMLEMLEIELEKVNDALARNASGQGDICTMCGGKIEEQRLRDLVNTTVCSKCAHNYDIAYQKSNEQPTMPGWMSDLGETFQVAGYELFEE